MKKNLIFFLILLMGCSSSPLYNALLDLEKEVEESPQHVLSSLNKMSSLSMNKKEQALYNLLLTKTLYVTDCHFNNDSLISQSISYYTSNDDPRLAESYFYKAAISMFFNLCPSDEYVKLFKMAEQLADNHHDIELQNKIFELLIKVNSDSRNNTLALFYSKKFLSTSILRNDTAAICRAYDDLSLIYKRLGFADSSVLYREACTEIMNVNQKNIGTQMANYANDLIEKGDIKKAKLQLLEATTLTPQANQYVMLGRIALLENDTATCVRYLQQALTFDNLRFSCKAYGLLSDIYFNKGQYQKAYALLDSAYECENELKLKNNSDNVASIQYKYSLAQQSESLTSIIHRWWILVVVLILMSLSAIALLQRKILSYKNIISIRMSELLDTKEKLEMMKQKEDNHQKDIQQLEKQISKLRASMASQLGRGREIYEKFIANTPPGKLDKAMVQDFIDFYAFSFPQKYHNLMLQYKKLTVRHALYVILLDLGKSDVEIQYLLDISSTTVRSYKHRIEKVNNN